jgi:hypothetical protein
MLPPLGLFREREQAIEDYMENERQKALKVGVTPRPGCPAPGGPVRA